MDLLVMANVILLVNSLKPIYFVFSVLTNDDALIESIPNWPPRSRRQWGPNENRTYNRLTINVRWCFLFFLQGRVAV